MDDWARLKEEEMGEGRGIEEMEELEEPVRLLIEGIVAVGSQKWHGVGA